VQIFLGTTVTLTAGFVSWLLRGGTLLASFLSTVPLFKRFDLLPILRESKKATVIPVIQKSVPMAGLTDHESEENPEETIEI
jgi:hypothetical protein